MPKQNYQTIEHSFNTSVAEKCGVIEVIIIKNFQFWIIKNKANNKHFYENHTCTYNSVKALSELFPYLTASKINYTINKLIKNQILIKGNFNKHWYDRTCSYAFKDEEMWLSGIWETTE